MKIINKRRFKAFYIGDRQLMRDTRISADSKNIYYLLSSLAESCDNIYPSYRWIAREIGYKTDIEITNDMTDEDIEKKVALKEDSIARFIKNKLKELVEFHLIVIIHRKGLTNNYEIYDYINLNEEIEKVTPNKIVGVTPNKIVGGTPNKIVGGEIREEKQEKRNENFDSENVKKTTLSDKDKIKLKEERAKIARELKQTLAEKKWT